MVAFNRLTKLCFTKGILNLLTRTQHNFVLRDFLVQRSLIFLTISFVLCLQRQITQGAGAEANILVNFAKFC